MKLLSITRYRLIKPKYFSCFDYNLDDEKECKTYVVAEDTDFRDEIDKKLIADAVREMLGTLTEREQKVIQYRFFEELTLKETGDKFNVTRERIRQIEGKALRKLRHPFRLERLKSIWKHEKPVACPLLTKIEIFPKVETIEDRPKEDEPKPIRRTKKKNKGYVRPLVRKVRRKEQSTRWNPLYAAPLPLSHHPISIEQKRKELKSMYPYCDKFVEEYEMIEIEDAFGGLVFSSKKPKPPWMYAVSGNTYDSLMWTLEMPFKYKGTVPPLHKDTYDRWVKEALEEALINI